MMRVYGILCVVMFLVVSTSFAMAQGVIPDPTITPGAVATVDRTEICAKGPPTYSRIHRDRVHDTVMKRMVMRTYGYPLSDEHLYEGDHLVELSIGGADVLSNFWAEPFEGPQNAHVKDLLEERVWKMLCVEGTLLPVQAQALFLAPADWRDSYRRIMGKEP